MISMGATAFFLFTSIIAHSPVTHNSENDLICMAHAIYFEAGNQDYDGKVAVASVIMNRVEGKGYPDSICGVVTQRHQFSYLLDDSKHHLQIKNKIDRQAFNESVRIGYHVAEGRLYDNTEGATHYYAQKLVTPHWTSHIDNAKIIEDHTFISLR